MNLYTSRGSTDLLHFLRPCTYQGAFSDPFADDEYELSHSHGEEGIKLSEQYWNEYDHDKFKKDVYDYYISDVVPAIVEVVQKTFPSFKIEEVVDEAKRILRSPQYYNYGTDWINFDYTIDEDEIKEWLIRPEGSIANQKLADYLQKNFSSCDGFISFTPNSIEGVRDAIADEDDGADRKDQAIFAIIGYLLDGDDVRDDLMQVVYGGIFSMTDYCSEELGNKITALLCKNR